MTRLGIKAYQAIILSARLILFLMSGHLCLIWAFFYRFICFTQFLCRLERNMQPTFLIEIRNSGQVIPIHGSYPAA